MTTATMLRKLGKLPVRTDVRTLRIGRYVDTAKLPEPPVALDLADRVGDWPMYANDRIGDCTIAAAGHMIEAWTAESRGEAVEVSEASVLARLRPREAGRPCHGRGGRRRARRPARLAPPRGGAPSDRRLRPCPGVRPRPRTGVCLAVRRPLRRGRAAADRAGPAGLGLDGVAHRAGEARLVGRPRDRPRRATARTVSPSSPGAGCRR